MEAERNFPQPPFLNVSERVAVHAVPVGIGGEAKSAVGLLTAAAATEKTASVAGNLVAGDGDVLEDALLHGVVVGIEGCVDAIQLASRAVTVSFVSTSSSVCGKV